ncbi:alpha/beta hydrolase [Colwellia sp. UCD-KL20]|uniref:alpha/beta hydrolase n=1 Tax=Colwellia sp. UCD-KL20 TaxID=1917165 RepID=UPI0009705D7E|nr:alpha/beta hydrolase [Colwellia sp. UCD-KL20]
MFKLFTRHILLQGIITCLLLSNQAIANDTPKNILSAPYVSKLVFPLWDKKIPNTKPSTETEIIDTKKIIRISKVQEPTIEVFLPDKSIATGQAVLIFPGGGYQMLAYDWEGQSIAQWLLTKGIAGIVVKYRLPNSNSIKIKHLAPLMDAKRAMQLTRFNAKQWNINPNNIGIMGFSAGGHLTSTLGTQFDQLTITNNQTSDDLSLTKNIDDISNRPNFMILMYPVISMMHDITHMGSRNNLLGKHPSKTLIKQYSNDLQVTKNTPPTFILHATDDKVVPVENSLRMYTALKNNNIPVALHIFPEGGHGFSMKSKYEPLTAWPNILHRWLRSLP